MKSIFLNDALEVLQDREKFLEKLNTDRYKANIIIPQVLLVFLFTFIYGMIMGSYNSLPQAISQG